MQHFLQLVLQSRERLEAIFKWQVFIGCSAKIMGDKLQVRCYTVQLPKNVLQCLCLETFL